MVFVASQCLLIGLGLFPQAKWRSFSKASGAAKAPAASAA
jgi:hypothetical protein